MQEETENIRNIYRKKQYHESQRKIIPIKRIGLTRNISEKLLFKNSFTLPKSITENGLKGHCHISTTSPLSSPVNFKYSPEEIKKILIKKNLFLHFSVLILSS